MRLRSRSRSKLPGRVAAHGGARLAAFSFGLSWLAACGLDAAEKPEKPPLVNVTSPRMEMPIEMRSNETLVLDDEFARALANNPAAEDSRLRMQAALAGEKEVYAASKLHGQARFDALERAARSGDAASAEALGDALDTGDGIKEDPARGVGYYRAAALGGRMEAAHSLAVAYAKGRGTRRDFTAALAWMIVARQRGDESGVEAQLRDYLHRHADDEAITAAETRAVELAKKVPREQIAAALPQVAALEFEEALTEPVEGSAAEDTHGTDASSETYPASAAPTVPPVVVMTVLGERLAWPTMAALERAANHGEPAAQAALGRLLTNGKLPSDPMRAILLLEQAAAKGEVDAAHQLGDLYSKGEGLVHDDAKAFAYTLQAARGGSTLAMANVGVFYTNGRGTERDLVRGLAWLTVAKSFGVDLGQEGRLRKFLTQYRPADVAAADEAATRLRTEAKVRTR